MSSIHHISTTKIKFHLFDALVIEDLSAVSSIHIQSQSWTKSNRDSLSNISLSRDVATRRSLLNYRQLFAILLSPIRLSKDGSESSKMTILPVMMIRAPVKPLAISGPILQKFLDRYPFSNTKVISRYFRLSPPTVKEILIRELGLKKFSRR
jgi:hypothetical protein